MNRIVTMILRQLINSGMTRATAASGALTKEQKEAQKRVRQAMKATRRMNRI
jgi:hypothetical protein